MNVTQQKCLYFYLNIKELHEKRLCHIRDLVHTYYTQRVRYIEQQNTTTSTPCALCHNLDSNNVVYIEAEGIRVCNGVDNNGCGYVLSENELMPPVYPMTETTLPYFSDMYYYKSSINKEGGLSRYNKKVERNLSKYISSNLITSDHYKNKQRKRVYALLDHIRESKLFDGVLIDKVKESFNQYRKAMSRIHNLKCVLYVLFELCLESKL